jgi:hypothetical protein
MSGTPDDLPAAAPMDVKPVAPDPDDYSGCCDSGCTPCIYDRYWEAVARYEVALAEWTSRHAADQG